MYKVFSHNDLDGYSINVLCRFYNIKVDCKNINNKLVDEELMSFFKSSEHYKYEKIFLCDVYPSEEVAKYINDNINNFILIDHHETGKILNKYSWAQITSELNGRPTCATELFYEYLKNNGKAVNTELMDTYVESIRLFDTGEYMLKNYSKKYYPEELSILFFLYFRNYWKHMLQNLKKGYILSFGDIDVASNMLNKISMVSKQKQKELFFIDFEGYKTGVFFLEESLYLSRILMDAKELYPEIELFMFIHVPTSVSLRSFGKINVSLIAQKYGGGGHEKAAGFIPDSKLLSRIIEEQKK